MLLGLVLNFYSFSLEAKEKIIFYDFITYVIIPKQNNEGVTTTPIQAINIIFYLEVYFVNYGLYT